MSRLCLHRDDGPATCVFAEEGKQTVASSVDDPAGASFDPITGGGACATASGANIDGAANYVLSEAPNGGYTLLGPPTIIAQIDSAGANSQLAARLVDIAPGGEETLVARGLYRPGVSVAGARQVFQLHGNAWKFEEGHQPKLELLPTDSPYGRASNGQGEVTITDLELRLPVHDRPGTGVVVTQRLEPFVPQGSELARDFRQLERPNSRRRR